MLDQADEPALCLRTRAFQSVKLGIKASEVNFEPPAHDPAPEFVLVGPDEAILYLDSLAKNSAFFSMPCCQLTRRKN